MPRLELDDLVDQEKGVAVGEDLLYFRASQRGGNRHGRPSVVRRGPVTEAGDRGPEAARAFRAPVRLRRGLPVDPAAARRGAFRRGRGTDRGADRGPRTARTQLAVAARSEPALLAPARAAGGDRAAPAADAHRGTGRLRRDR